MNPASEPSSEDEDGDKPRMHFGRLEDLEIFERNKHLFTKSAVVTCSICQLYVGHPDVIREHEASHSAPVEELPDYTELYRSIREEQKQQAENVIMAKKKEKSDAWKGFLFEVFSRDPPRIHHEDFQDLEILVEVDGESIDVRRFEELMTEDGLRSASALSTTESSGLYAKTCPECSKGFVKMQDYLQHREMYHGDSPRMTESHRISGPHSEEAREDGAEGNIRRDDYFLRREWYHGDSPQATEWQENPVYKWTCTVCGKGFVNGETYTRHRSQPPCGDCRPES